MKRKKTIEYASPKNGKRGASRGRHPIFLPKIVAWPKIRKKRIIDSPAIKDESREKNEALEKGERETCRVDDVQSYQKLYQKLYNPRQKKKDQRFFDDKWNENKEHHVDTQPSRSFYQKLTKLKTKKKRKYQRFSNVERKEWSASKKERNRKRRGGGTCVGRQTTKMDLWMDAAMEEARLKRTRKLGEGLVAMCMCVCVCVPPVMDYPATRMETVGARLL